MELILSVSFGDHWCDVRDPAGKRRDGRDQSPILNGDNEGFLLVPGATRVPHDRGLVGDEHFSARRAVNGAPELYFDGRAEYQRRLHAAAGGNHVGITEGGSKSFRNEFERIVNSRRN